MWESNPGSQKLDAAALPATPLGRLARLRWYRHNFELCFWRHVRTIANFLVQWCLRRHIRGRLGIPSEGGGPPTLDCLINSLFIHINIHLEAAAYLLSDIEMRRL